jgi:hypothetical protein
MSYLVFLLVALSVTVLLAVAHAGPLSVFCIVGFWVAHYVFVKWNREVASVKVMTDAQLHDTLRDWASPGFNRYASPYLTKVRQSGDETEIKKSIPESLLSMVN